MIIARQGKESPVNFFLDLFSLFDHLPSPAEETPWDVWTAAFIGRFRPLGRRSAALPPQHDVRDQRFRRILP